MAQAFTYKTLIKKNGDILRYRCWKETFGRGRNKVTVDRHELIKVNGIPVRFYPFSELKRMTPEQRKQIEI